MRLLISLSDAWLVAQKMLMHKVISDILLGQWVWWLVGNALLLMLGLEAKPQSEADATSYLWKICYCWKMSKTFSLVEMASRLRVATQSVSMVWPNNPAAWGLQTALTASTRPPVLNLYERVRARFASLGGVDLELPER